jgi:lipopolysaccharide export system permease protein
MGVLEQYILKRVLLQTFAAIVVSFGIVWTIQALTKINLVTDSGQSIGAFLFLATLLLPAMIPVVLPFSILIATMNSLSVLNSDSELAVINASGAGPKVLFKPILIVALIAAFITLLSSNFVEPYSRQQARTLITKAKADLITLIIKEGQFKKIDENLYIQVGERLSNGILSGLFLADSRDKQFNTLYYARQGALLQEKDASLLVMQDGEIQRRNVKTGQLSLIRFSNYAFDLSQFTATSRKPQLLPKDQTTPYLLSPDANDRLFQQNPLFFSAELHKRFSKWLYTIAFAMIALALCAQVRSHRQTALLPHLYTVISAFIVRWLGILAEDWAEKNAISGMLLYFIPLATVGLSVWFIYKQRFFKSVPIDLSLNVRKNVFDTVQTNRNTHWRGIEKEKIS